MLGIELLDAGAIAVDVDEGGTVRARADVVDGDIAAAALAALGKLSAPGDASAAVASANPESPAAAAAIGALAKKLRGGLNPKTAIPSGAAAASAEGWIGAARGIHDVVYFSVADHATAGILRQGAPITGANGRAASAAWIGLNPVEREDYRKVGCVEAEVAASGIVRRLIWRIKAGDRSRVQEVVNGDLGSVTIEHVLSSARAGDGVAVSVMRDTAKYLGMAAANLVVVADPQMLVLGGIIATAADLLLEPVRSEIARRLPAAMMKSLTIASATLGGDAPAIGAARLSSIPSQ